MRPVLLLLLGAHLAYAGSHSFKAFYTATTGVTNFPEFTAMGVVDGRLITHYDSISKQTVPRTEWMKSSEGPEYWKQQTDIIVGTEPSFKNNLQVAMGRFNQTGGVHVFQQMYGCSWDKESGDVDGFDDFGYDGESFLSLDLKNLRYISTGPEALITQVNWNNDKAYLERKKQYRTQECTEWLKKYLQYGKSTLEREVSPKVSLLQKDPSSPVACHATGFYPSGVTISWKKNGQDHDEDVDLSEIVPNEDGTFQVTSTLNVKPEEWKKNEYNCVVEHKSRTTRSVLTEKEIITNYESLPIGIIAGVVAVVLLLVIIGVAGYFVYQKRKGFKPVSASDDGSNSSTRTDPHA